MKRGSTEIEPGSRYKTEKWGFFGGGAASLNLCGLTFSESVYPARLRMARHQHDPAYFGLVLQGGYVESLGLQSQTREAGPMAAFFHPQGESHKVEFLDEKVRIFRIEIGRQWQSRVEGGCRIPDEPLAIQSGSLSSLALRLYREYRNPDQWSPLSIEGLSLEIMAELSRQSIRSSGRDWLLNVREILVDNFINPPTLTELASQVGVHPVHLAREFRRHFNCSIGDFCRKLRIERAGRELATSDISISQIALAYGFYDQSHFTNTFKKYTGMSPAAYRTLCSES